jgi:hypothetical protein
MKFQKPTISVWSLAGSGFDLALGRLEELPDKESINSSRLTMPSLLVSAPVGGRYRGSPVGLQRRRTAEDSAVQNLIIERRAANETGTEGMNKHTYRSAAAVAASSSISLVPREQPSTYELPTIECRYRVQ